MLGDARFQIGVGGIRNVGFQAETFDVVAFDWRQDFPRQPRSAFLQFQQERRAGTVDDHFLGQFQRVEIGWNGILRIPVRPREEVPRPDGPGLSGNKAGQLDEIQNVLAPVERDRAAGDDKTPDFSIVGEKRDKEKRERDETSVKTAFRLLNFLYI